MRTHQSADRFLDGLKEAFQIPTDKALALWLGVASQSVAQARRRNKVPEAWYFQASQRAGVSIDSLYYGEAVAAERQDEEAIAYVPLVAARLSAGGGSFEAEKTVLDRYAFRTEWLNRKGRISDMVLMRVAGDSMEPTIFNNDLVLVDQRRRSIIPMGIYAVGVDDGIYVKQLETLPGKHLVLRSFNERYAPMDIDMNGDLADSVRIIGKVIWWCHEA